MSISDLDLKAINAQLRDKSPREIIEWATTLGKRVFATTSFGPNSALMLNEISAVSKEIPVVWVDHGYNVKPAYLVAEELMNLLDLDMRIYVPEVTAERRTALMGGIPSVDEPEQHAEFTRQVKLEPFAKALAEIRPEVWLTGIRQSDTEHRQGLDIVTIDNRGMLKVAPIFYWSEDDIERYMKEHQLPSCAHYFDPTKVHDHRECGLHTLAN
jgi:phosphoadenosine phosphosulfate reductase